MLDKGDTIGDYTLVRFLGRGQFGEVWLAEKQLAFSQRKVQHALKFLSNVLDEINVKAAGREIDTWIEASGHPNVMSVLDMIVHDDRIIIASEYAEGGSLMGWLKKSDGKAPSHEKALEMMTGILNGIEHLHSRNVVHRDLKPDNILLQGNFPRITDFGISRIVSAGSMSTVAMGSPFYMSPESFDGNKSTSTDIWSAGVILYEMLTGEHPYRSDTMYGLISSIRQDEPKPLPENVPIELRHVVETALQKDLAKRYATADEMRQAVEQEIYGLKANAKSRSDLAAEVKLPDIDPGAVTIASSNFDLTAVLENAADSAEKMFTDSLRNKAKDKPAETPPPVTAIPQTPPAAANLSGEEIATSEVTHTPPPIITNPDMPRPPVQAPYSYTPPPPQNIPQTAVMGAPTPDNAFRVPIGTGFETTSQPEVAGKITNQQFAQSQSQISKKPTLLFAGIGGIVLVAFIIGCVALFFASREIMSRMSNSNTAATATNSKPATNGATTTSQPQIPDGMAYVPGEEFTMGRDDAKIPDEGPSHKSTVNPFYMDKYEVSNQQYAKFVAETGYKSPSSWKGNAVRPGDEDLPVVGVNWEDANAYAKWAKKRLPTEAEWEFAARGTDGRLYPWGAEWAPRMANVDKIKGSFSKVGEFDGKSPFGIYDLIGNAAEWTADDFKAYPDGRLSPDYAGKTGLKTIRGNHFEATKDYSTTTYRYGWAAKGALTYANVGFRCVKGVGE